MELLCRTLENLADRCEGYRARLLDARFRVLPSPDRHTEILAAIAEHDADRTADALRTHVLAGMEALLEQINLPDPNDEN
jgi:DNA-binding GntR family transcriptional regulator